MDNIGAHVATAAACLLFAASIATDVRRRRIPNAVPVLLLALFALYAAAGAVRPAEALWEHLAVGTAILAAGFALYLSGRFGAGDGKLLAVAGVWVGPSLADLSIFFCSLAAFAFVLCLVAMLPLERTRRMRAELPFAVAIAPAAMIVLSLRTYSDGI